MAEHTPHAATGSPEETGVGGYEQPRLTRLGTMAELTLGSGATPFSDGVGPFISGLP